MKLVDINCIRKIIKKVGLFNLFDLVIERIEYDYKNWDDFVKNPRHATHSDVGVIELMPASDSEYYGFKYVNGHPGNTKDGKLSVMALGMLATIGDGLPVMFCEMTLLTAIRTAATSALVAKYCAKPSSKVLGVIGTGAQAEFQIIALSRVFKFEKIIGYDNNYAALEKTKYNLKQLNIDFIIANSLDEVLVDVDILTTATANKKKDVILNADDVPEGCHINAIGGDCPGKTELDINQFTNSHIVVEYLPQTQIEGEIQDLKTDIPLTEFHDVVKYNVVPRKDDKMITIFDSVGFALEDYSALRVIYDLASQHNIFITGDFIPKVSDPKNLFATILDVA